MSKFLTDTIAKNFTKYFCTFYCFILRIFFEEKILTEGILDELSVKHIEDEIQTEILAAFDFAERSPFPEPGYAFQGIFAEKTETNG